MKTPAPAFVSANDVPEGGVTGLNLNPDNHQPATQVCQAKAGFRKHRSEFSVGILKCGYCGHGKHSLFRDSDRCSSGIAEGRQPLGSTPRLPKGECPCQELEAIHLTLLSAQNLVRYQQKRRTGSFRKFCVSHQLLKARVGTERSKYRIDFGAPRTIIIVPLIFLVEPCQSSTPMLKSDFDER